MPAKTETPGQQSRRLRRARNYLRRAAAGRLPVTAVQREREARARALLLAQALGRPLP